MSTFAVTVERLDVHPHPNADALELAGVGGYRAVVAKGAYQTGDLAVYIPEQAIVPEGLIAELGLTGKLAGKGKDRVKAIRLRGELSQGIVCRPAVIDAAEYAELASGGADLAERLGITKYEPEVPTHMAGEVAPAPDFVPMFEVEDIKRYPGVFTDSEPVIMTEKTHGTNIGITFRGTPDGYVVEVSSKGMGAKRLALVRSETNVYWRAVEAHKLEDLAFHLLHELETTEVALFGEVYGAGVQDLGYGARAGVQPGFVLFDIAYTTSSGERVFVDAGVLDDVVAGRAQVAPVLYAGPYDYPALVEAAAGLETLSGEGLHVREGGVVRPAQERYSPELGGRAIAKFINPDYLTRKGGTEYQ